MMEIQPPIFVVDDDDFIRSALACLLTAHGFRVHAFGSAREFLAAGDACERPACLLLDIVMPVMNGFELQERLACDKSLPIVFMSGHGDIPTAIKAVKQGAINFLAKPFTEQDLLNSVRDALQASRQECEYLLKRKSKQDRLTCLTAREVDVMQHVIEGKLNKQIAAELGISEKTVKIHRGHVMHKLMAKSLPDLIRIVN